MLRPLGFKVEFRVQGFWGFGFWVSGLKLGVEFVVSGFELVGPQVRDLGSTEFSGHCYGGHQGVATWILGI